MRNDHSFGITPLRRGRDGWEVLLVKHRHGNHFCFPKGHPFPGETAKACAVRELFEETGLSVVTILSNTPFWESYYFFVNRERVYKTVAYFPAEVQGSLLLQESEISAAQWIILHEAIFLVTFPQAKSICNQLMHMMERYSLGE